MRNSQFTAQSLRLYCVDHFWDPIQSNRVLERLSKLTMNASLAFDQASAGMSRNLWMPLSIGKLWKSGNDCGHRP